MRTHPPLEAQKSLGLSQIRPTPIAQGVGVPVSTGRGGLSTAGSRSIVAPGAVKKKTKENEKLKEKIFHGGSDDDSE